MTTREHWLIPDEPYDSYDAYRRATGGCAVELAWRREPAAVIAEIAASGLRGRGGGGFPTGTKWASIADHPCATRYLVCNAAEGEPGTFKDRWLLRHNPYAVIEGMLIGAHAVGARGLYIGLKASFFPELARVRAAIDELGAAGLTDDVELHVVEGPDEYLFGEEKALLEVIEGNEPLPREPHYPPYERGLFAAPGSPNPCLVNNAETFAHVPGIVRAGAASFRALGTANTPGTCIYTISGDVVRPGVFEREAGVTLRELIYDAAGGPRDGRAIALVLPGVASRPIPPDKLDTRADFAALSLIGAGLGSGGFMVFDDTRNPVRIAQAVARFLYVESCNQCSACKHGLGVASSAIDELFDPETATPDDYPRALYGARSAPQGNRCYLPVQGSILIPGLMQQFEDEFEAQLQSPDRDVEPVDTIVALTDYDPTTHRFHYDERQRRKQPDWTYEAEPREPARLSVTIPRDAERAPVAVRVPTHLVGPLRARADAAGISLDRAVEAALQAWIDDAADGD